MTGFVSILPLSFFLVCAVCVHSGATHGPTDVEMSLIKSPPPHDKREKSLREDDKFLVLLFLLP
jgi:hypothetical protein